MGGQATSVSLMADFETLLDIVDASSINSGISVSFADSAHQAIAQNTGNNPTIYFSGAEGFIGTNYDDLIKGGERLFSVNTGGGNDWVETTADDAHIDLGSGNDKLIDYGKGAVIKTGQGADVIGMNGSFIYCVGAYTKTSPLLCNFHLQPDVRSGINC